MSSRDGSDRTGRPRRSTQPTRGENPPRQSPRGAQPNWDIDPAEIDRYLSGRPSREQESSTTARARPRPNPASGTANQLDRLQRAVGDRRTSQQPPVRRTSRPASAGRQQFAEPEYGDAGSADHRYTPEDHDDDDAYVEEPAAPAPRSRRQPQRRQAATPAAPSRRQRPQPARPPQPVYEDDHGYDDELYADDPYLTYDKDEDWQEPAPRRAAGARPRPQVKFNKPNLPKLSVPKSISGAELINDVPSLAMIGTGVLSAAIMAILISNRMESLPDIIPTHVSASGVAENLRGRGALWSVPLLITALSLMNIVAAWFFARIDMFAARFMLGAALLVQFIAWIAVIRYLWD